MTLPVPVSATHRLPLWSTATPATATKWPCGAVVPSIVDWNLPLAGELQDHVVAGVADVHACLATGSWSCPPRRWWDWRTGPRPSRGCRPGTRLALADLALLGAGLDAPSPGALELALLVEPLDPRVRAIGDVDLAAALIDGDAERDLELAGAGAGAAERAEPASGTTRASGTSCRRRSSSPPGSSRPPGSDRVVPGVRPVAVALARLRIEARAEIDRRARHARRRAVAAALEGGIADVLELAGRLEAGRDDGRIQRGAGVGDVRRRLAHDDGSPAVRNVVSGPFVVPASSSPPPGSDRACRRQPAHVRARLYEDAADRAQARGHARDTRRGVVAAGLEAGIVDVLEHAGRLEAGRIDRRVQRRVVSVTFVAGWL